MSLDTDDVVWHEAPFKAPSSGGNQPDRPWLIISNNNHPFHGNEYTVLGMTTNSRSQGIRVQQNDWNDGGTSKTSFISLWFAMTLKHSDINYRIGAIQDSLVTTAINDLSSRLGPKTGNTTTD